MADIELITTDEICAILRISRATLFRMLKENTFPKPMRYTRRDIWNKAEVTNWINTQLAGR